MFFACCLERSHRHAYHLVCITDRDKWKTSFRTHYGFFKWLVMPFGLTNAPTAFQHFVNSIFTNMLDMCIMVYLNDILIYSSDLTSHHKYIRDILRCLCTNGLYLKPEKCEWHLETIKYLRYILSLSGLSMACDKIQTVLDWPELWKVKDIQSFLGFTNFTTGSSRATWTLWSLSPTSPEKEFLGTSLTTVRSPSST